MSAGISGPGSGQSGPQPGPNQTFVPDDNPNTAWKLGVVPEDQMKGHTFDAEHLRRSLAAVAAQPDISAPVVKKEPVHGKDRIQTRERREALRQLVGRIQARRVIQRKASVILSDDEVEEDEERLLRGRPEPSPWTGVISASGAGSSSGMYAGGSSFLKRGNLFGELPSRQGQVSLTRPVSTGGVIGMGNQSEVHGWRTEANLPADLRNSRLIPSNLPKTLIRRKRR